MKSRPKQQTLLQWAQLITQGKITNLKQIKQPNFISNLLLKLQPSYFTTVLNGSTSTSGLTFPKLYLQITQYYTNQLDIDITKFIGPNPNIQSGSAVVLVEMWQLVLGIAIKGRNRENNINAILNMRQQSQEDMMRVIAKLINSLGENVLVIEEVRSSEVIGSGKGTNANIIADLEEENEQRKEKIDELQNEVAMLRDKNRSLKSEVDERNREQAAIIELMGRQSVVVQSKGGRNSVNNYENSKMIIEFVRDMMTQVEILYKQLTRKEERLQSLEDANRQMKVVYSALVLELDNVKKVEWRNNLDIGNYVNQIEQLKVENREYGERQKEYLAKIACLEQQKYYLNQRLQSKANVSFPVIKSTEPVPIPKQQQKTLQKPSFGTHYQNTNKNTNTWHAVDDKYNTVNKEINESEPERERKRKKLEKQMDELQKKIGLLSEQNFKLKKINQLMEKIVGEFTKENVDLMHRYEDQVEPIFKQLQQILEKQQKNKKKLSEDEQIKQHQNEQKIKQLIFKMKMKMEQYEQRCVDYQKIIKRLQISREELLKNLQIFGDQPALGQIAQKPLSNSQTENNLISATVNSQNNAENTKIIANADNHLQQQTQLSQTPPIIPQNQQSLPHNNSILKNRQTCQSADDDINDHPSDSQQHVEIVDITQVEEELAKIKEYYVLMRNQSMSINQLMKMEKKDGRKANNVNEIGKNGQSLGIPNQESPEKVETYLQKLQNNALQKAQTSSHTITLHQQTTALKSQIAASKKQRKAIEQHLLNFQNQSSKYMDIGIKQQLNKLASELQQIRAMMLQSQNSYLELSSSMGNVPSKDNQQVNMLTERIQQLQEELKKRDSKVAQMEIEMNLLVSTFLELRNWEVQSF